MLLLLKTLLSPEVLKNLPTIIGLLNEMIEFFKWAWDQKEHADQTKEFTQKLKEAREKGDTTELAQWMANIRAANAK